MGYSVSGPVVWEKSGDYPGIIPFKSADIKPLAKCPKCGKLYKDHGILQRNSTYVDPDINKYPQMPYNVCPGSYVIESTTPVGDKSIMVLSKEDYERYMAGSGGGAVGGAGVLKHEPRIEALEARMTAVEAKV